MSDEWSRRRFVELVTAGLGALTAGCQARGCTTRAEFKLKPRSEVANDPDPTPPQSVLEEEAVDLDRKPLSDEQSQIITQATTGKDGYGTCLDTPKPAFEDLLVRIFAGDQAVETPHREQLRRASFTPFTPVVWNETQYIAFYWVTHRN